MKLHYQTRLAGSILSRRLPNMASSGQRVRGGFLMVLCSPAAAHASRWVGRVVVKVKRGVGEKGGGE